MPLFGRLPEMKAEIDALKEKLKHLDEELQVLRDRTP